MANFGRPGKLNDETQAAVISAIEKGATYELAAGSANISYDSLNYWRKLGKADLEQDIESIYSNFYIAIKKAHSTRALKWLKQIEEAAEDNKNWTAAAWLLERCHREDYSKDAAELQEIKRLHAEVKQFVEKAGLTTE